jgi:ZIP family zinc transporter
MMEGDEAWKAVVWGALAAAGLPLGALLAWWVPFSHRAIARWTAFGGGVLLAILSLELVTEAGEAGGARLFSPCFLAGALLFSGINWRLSVRGAQRRKRCGECVKQPSEAQQPGSGQAILLGVVLDGVPEALVLGLTLGAGGGAPVPLLLGFLLANVPQGLSATSGMRDAGRSPRQVYAVWGAVVAASAGVAWAGAAALAGAPPALRAVAMTLAAGAVLAMLAEAMIPEAFHGEMHFSGLVTAAGFVAAFALHRVTG